MAKRNKLSPWVLCVAAAMLASAGTLMRTFPILIFVGFAPLFAIADRASESESQSAWNYIELILISLVIFYFSGHMLNADHIVYTLLQAIVVALAFAAYSFSKINLGQRLTLLVLILYWLAAEYLFLKIDPSKFVYLADAVQLKPDWRRWNQHTGYLGSSLWILVCNILIYQSFLKGKVNWFFLIAFVAAIVTPIWYSLTLVAEPITREMMMTLYQGGTVGLSEKYVGFGEFICRTAAWISTLVLLFSVVKNRTKRK